MSGSLFLVGTPIGNLGDLSPRAVEVLSSVQLVCCEDTRRTGRLLQLAGVSGPRLRRVDEHTEDAAARKVCELLAAGGSVAMVVDAGMPGVCDPGSRLVEACADAGHTITVVPGPSAGVTALAVSGLAAGRHAFEGFLPRRGRARAERLAQVAREPRTVVLYESPHRLADCLSDLVTACGPERRAAVARELTKLHEEVVRATLSELRDWAASAPVRGEVVLVVQGAPEDVAETGDEELREALAACLREGMSRRDAAAAVAAARAISRRRVYSLLPQVPAP